MFNLSDLQSAKEVERKLIEVPEVLHKGEPLRFFVSEVTCRDASKLERKQKELSVHEFMVELIILKAEDENGEKAFTLEHKPFLMGRRQDIIARIFNQIYAPTTVEEHEKN